MTFCLYSTPIVGMCVGLNSWSMNWESKLVFPTPPSPRIRIFTRGVEFVIYIYMQWLRQDSWLFRSHFSRFQSGTHHNITGI